MHFTIHTVYTTIQVFRVLVFEELWNIEDCSNDCWKFTEINDHLQY